MRAVHSKRIMLLKGFALYYSFVVALHRHSTEERTFRGATPPKEDMRSNCYKPLINELGSTNVRSKFGLVAKAFSTSNAYQFYKIIELNIVCLAQGVIKDRYRYASAIVKYEVEGYNSDWIYKRQVVVKQFEFYCSKNKWKVVKRPKFDSAYFYTPAIGNFTTPIQYNCEKCVNPTIRPSSLAEHCVPCPAKCNGRCTSNTTCCNVFDFKRRCALKCPMNSYKTSDHVCACKHGYVVFWGRSCVKGCVCQNGGTCDQNTGRCYCPKGYVGARCEKCIKDRIFQKKGKCIKKVKPCQISYIKEPPSFSKIKCNPFEGSGYSLQCAAKVDKTLAHQVDLKWWFISYNGRQIDLENPSLKSFVEFSKSETDSDGFPHVYSTLRTKFIDAGGVFGVNLDEFVFSYLRGGVIYCQAVMKMADSNKTLLATNFLALPIDLPTHLPPCNQYTMYTTKVNKCIYPEPEGQSPNILLRVAAMKFNHSLGVAHWWPRYYNRRNITLYHSNRHFPNYTGQLNSKSQLLNMTEAKKQTFNFLPRLRLLQHNRSKRTNLSKQTYSPSEAAVVFKDKEQSSGMQSTEETKKVNTASWPIPVLATVGSLAAFILISIPVVTALILKFKKIWGVSSVSPATAGASNPMFMQELETLSANNLPVAEAPIVRDRVEMNA